MEQLDLVIYGAGALGCTMYEKFKRAGCKVSFFCDRDTEKQKIGVCGIPVISFETLCGMKERVAVFISLNNAKGIYEQFRENKFPYLMPEFFSFALKGTPLFNEPGVFQNFYPIGHFYSLYPDLDEILQRQEEVFSQDKAVLDVDLNLEFQISVFEKLQPFYQTLPQWKHLGESNQESPFRYRYDNLTLSAGDAVHLHCMLQLLNPKRLIEVGSGYTSAITLDTNEYYLNNEMQISFIEPYPELLQSLLKPSDHVTLKECGLQEVPLEYFDQLESGDVLFVDSTHASKIGSDVNYLFFEIFPRLKKGVYIHLHDIFYPFEYLKEWIVNGMIWNELYLLRAFLQNNTSYSVQYFQNMMEKLYPEKMKERWPLEEIPHGGSFWMQKVK